MIDSDSTVDQTPSTEEAIANRVSASGNVGMDPITVLKIVQVVLPLLIRCFGGDDQPDPSQVRASLVEQNAKQPRRLRRRMTARIMRDSDHPLTREQAEAIAEATIDESLTKNDEEVTSFVKLHL